MMEQVTDMERSECASWLSSCRLCLCGDLELRVGDTAVLCHRDGARDTEGVTPPICRWHQAPVLGCPFICCFSKVQVRCC